MKEEHRSEFELRHEEAQLPELVTVDLFQYATRGDPHHPRPYVWVITYESIDSDYEHLKEALKTHYTRENVSYWECYVLPGKLKIRRIRDGYGYAFEDRPVVYILAGHPKVTRAAFMDRPHVCEHQAAFTVSILKTLGLVKGYRRERRPMTEAELTEIPVKLG